MEIEELTKNTFDQWEEKPSGDIPTVTNQIYNFINTYLKREKDTHVNRASSASMCFKRRWYQRNGFEGTPLTPRKIVNFLLGDLSEKTMQFFIREGCVGDGRIYSEVDFGMEIGSFTTNGKKIAVYEQQALTADLNGLTVTAHVDGWGKRNSDGQWELIECKSAADYGFEDFKTKDPGSYLNQAHVNMMTTKGKELGVKSVRFFYLKKNTGHLWDRLFHFDSDLYNDVVAEYKISNQETEPQRPHVPKMETFRGKETGRKVLPFPCSGYCPYTEICWPKAIKTWEKSKYVYEVKSAEET